jgi:hypothetical protein
MLLRWPPLADATTSSTTGKPTKVNNILSFLCMVVIAAALFAAAVTSVRLWW